MQKGIQAPRGMNDFLPSQTRIWGIVEAVIKETVASYGYQEIRFPVLENTALFERSIGAVTDIVEKEMYTFLDRNQESLTLRPEGTAGCVRACIEQGLLHNQTQRLWYLGPMFRYERPQKGRFRQFHQFGVEVFGIETPDIDAEVILLSAAIWRALGLSDVMTLHLNSLGTLTNRQQYRAELLRYFEAHRGKLDADSVRRLQTNPLRILDSKNPEMKSLIAEAPQLLHHLDSTSKEHFDKVCDFLNACHVPFVLDSTLVRGLDYYGRTTFEWVATGIGAQSSVCGGGRYDDLVQQLGGQSTPAVGFAIGLERLVDLYQEKIKADAQTTVDVYIVSDTTQAMPESLLMAEMLREAMPYLRVMTHCGQGGFKSQFKRADKYGAEIALILGTAEIDAGTVGVKYLREDRPQENISKAHIISLIRTHYETRHRVVSTGSTSTR